MGRVTRRRVAGMVAAMLGVALALPPAAAALLVWTLVATPLAATAGQLTTFTLTATNGDLLTELGCLEVNLPASYQNVTAFGASASNGDDWTASAGGTNVVVHSLSGGGRLELLQTVTFKISARPTVAGLTTWPNHAHRDQGCSGADEAGLPLAITVLLPTPTPTPEPTPRPTLLPTPTAPPPTLSPTLPLPSLPVPSLPLPTLPLPSLPQPSSSAPATVSPTPAPGTSDSPRSSPTPAPGASVGAPTPTASVAAAPSASSGADGGPASPSGGSTDSGGGDPESHLPSIRFEERQLDLGGASVGLFAGVEIWAVPAATIAVPGLLVLLWVALQAAGAIAWIPAVRRLKGKSGPSGRTRFGTPAS